MKREDSSMQILSCCPTRGALWGGGHRHAGIAQQVACKPHLGLALGLEHFSSHQPDHQPQGARC